MTITQHNYLDLGNLIINEIVGDVWLTFFLGSAILVGLCVYNKVPYWGIIGLIMLYASLILAYAYASILWMLILLGAALIFYLAVARMINRS